VLLRNVEVFKFWRKLGLRYMFLGMEAIDEEGLKRYRKRTSVDQNFEALETARKIGIRAAINLIADPDWDRDRFAVVRAWAREIPEMVNISVNTPYPGTESWRTEARKLVARDYRLFDIQHVVLPTKLPLAEFYEELATTQRVLNRKHISRRTVRGAVKTAGKRLMKGQTNFAKMLWKFDSVYNAKSFLADHSKPVEYEIALPPEQQDSIDPKLLYIHEPRGRRSRAVDDETEQFVERTRMGTSI
jgi:hopanoid C-3 methylase HpnR